MAWLALGCVLFGLFPVAVITRLDAVLTLLTGTGIARTAGQNLLFLTPLSPDRASYSAMVFLLAVLIGIALAFFGIRFFIMVASGALRHGTVVSMSSIRTWKILQKALANRFGKFLKVFLQWSGTCPIL